MNKQKCWICGRTEEESLQEFKKRIIDTESQDVQGDRYTNVPIEEIKRDSIKTVPIVIDESSYKMEHNYLEQSYMNLEMYFKLSLEVGDRLYIDGTDTYVTSIDICPVCATLLNMMKARNNGK